MDEAGLCDRVALIQNGRLLSINTPQGVIESFDRSLLAVKTERMLPLLNDLKTYEGAEDAYPFGENHHVVLKNGYDERSVDQFLQHKGYDDVRIRAIKPDIEDCFMRLMTETSAT